MRSIDSITGNVSSYNFTNDTIYIQLDKSYPSDAVAEARIYYHGEPQSTEEVCGFQHHTSTAGPKIATLCEPFFSCYWWPCKDGAGDKADSVFLDVTITDTSINSVELIAVSNGVLENTITAAGKKTFQWRERYSIATYYVGIAISNYKHFQQSYSGKYGENFSIDYYVFPENYDISQTQVTQLPEVMTFFSELFGKYPFHREKYAMTQIDSAIAVGLENQTNTVAGASLWHYFDPHVHELTHSWFGCMISFEHFQYAWTKGSYARFWRTAGGNVYCRMACWGISQRHIFL